jgi:hypothetical protein
MPENQDYTSLKMAFEPFAKFEQGTPIRVLPEGTWYRGTRKLEVTKERLLEMARNFASGLPRFRIPINLDHADKGGKVGTIKNLQYLPNGPKGSGLYATEYEFEEKGLEAIEENGYDAVSAEVVWTVGGKPGGKYQDPEHGTMHDNVLVGMALTPKPFFGHRNVALFCADQPVAAETPLGGAKSFAEYEQYLGDSEERNRISNLHNIFRSLFDNIWNDAEVGLRTKIEFIDKLTKEFRGKVSSGDEYAEDKLAQEEVMTDKEKTEETPKADVFDGVQMSQEDFDALSAKAELADEQQEELDRMAEEKAVADADAFAAELRGVAESYKALPVEVDEFVENMTAIDIAGEKVVEWLKVQFTAFDAALEAAGVMKEIGTDEEREVSTTEGLLESVDQIIKDEFDGDVSKYAEALELASERSEAKLV